ncbi:phospholipase A2 [Trichuris suis]|nr:phospholipase A2 [Trichuris suis]
MEDGLIYAASAYLGNLTGLEYLLRCIAKAPASKYLGYGCWCSTFKDRRPVDNIDMCCYFEHSCKQLIKKHGCTERESRTMYNVECLGHGNAVCQLQGNTLCGYSLCECQRLFALCVAQYHYPKEKPICK